MTTTTTPHVRWMIRRDMSGVLDIEARSFDHPWSDEDFYRLLRRRNCIGMIAEQDDDVIGYMMYELNKNDVTVFNFAVAPDHRRQGIGTLLVGKLAAKLTQHRRSRLIVHVRESNTPAQLFFRAVGFECVSILQDHYDGEDAYRFIYFRGAA